MSTPNSVPAPKITAPPDASGAFGLTRAYRRLPAVETAIRALPPVTDPAFLPSLHAAPALETVVHGIRRLLAAGREADAQLAGDWLITRIKPLLTRLAARYVATPTDRDDLIQATLLHIWADIRAGGPAHEFLEVHFAHALAATCADMADRQRRPHTFERPFACRRDANGQPRDELDTVPDPHPGEPPLWLATALAQLDGRARRAVSLKLLGYLEASNDPNETTICRLLGCSERTVRNILARAYGVLRVWLAAHPEALDGLTVPIPVSIDRAQAA